ncbi:hypothetical protein GC163_12565 [bacterium]|nr:hypothetical protein [bacterium]
MTEQPDAAWLKAWHGEWDNQTVSALGYGDPPVITSSLTATGRKGIAFSYLITADNSPTSFDATGLPAGLSVNTSTGAITGTATVSSTNNVTISAMNAFGTDSETLVLEMKSDTEVPVIADYSAGQEFEYQPTTTYITVTGEDPLAWSASDLPDGLAINSSTGRITGTLPVPGTYHFTVTATTELEVEGSRLFSLSVRQTD